MKMYLIVHKGRQKKKKTQCIANLLEDRRDVSIMKAVWSFTKFYYV